MYDFSTSEAPEARSSQDRLPAMTGVFRAKAPEWKPTKTGKVMVTITWVCQKPDHYDTELKIDNPKGMEHTEYYVLGTSDDPLCKNKETMTNGQKAAPGTARLRQIAEAIGHAGSWGMALEDGAVVPRGLMNAISGKDVGIVVEHKFDTEGGFTWRYKPNMKKYQAASLTKPQFSATQAQDKPQAGLDSQTNSNQPVGAAID